MLSKRVFDRYIIFALGTSD